jgi:hypothetical protein
VALKTRREDPSDELHDTVLKRDRAETIGCEHVILFWKQGYERTVNTVQGRGPVMAR